MSAPILVVDDLAVKRSGRLVLDGVSVTAAPGDVLGVVGANGAGKSTMLAVIAGVLGRARGLVTIDGHRAGTVGAQRLVGYVPEAANPPGHLTGDEVVELVAAIKGATLDDATAGALAFDELRAQRIDRMSLGQRRRTCLAAALVGSPRVLVLDEPSNGLDAGGEHVLRELLAARAAAGAAVVIASHDAPLLDALGARRLRLDAGRGAP
jgi:ABC-type multidrug transport system ATPase subunit